MITFLNVMSLHPVHMPDGDNLAQLGALSVGLHCAHGCLVPTRTQAREQLAMAWAQLLLWARDTHHAEWIWFDPSTQINDTLPQYEVPEFLRQAAASGGQSA